MQLVFLSESGKIGGNFQTFPIEHGILKTPCLNLELLPIAILKIIIEILAKAELYIRFARKKKI